jgi:hypothetical protein
MIKRLLLSGAILSSSSPAFSLDDLTIAAIYATDRVLCNLYVPQTAIDQALANVVVQYDISPSQAILAAAEIGTALEGNVRQSGRIAEYCAGRTKK